LQWIVCMTLDCVGLTQSIVIRTFTAMLVWSVFFHLPKFLLLSLVFAYIYISQSSVKTHSTCGETYNNHIIANCLQSVPAKEFWKSINNWWRYGPECTFSKYMCREWHLVLDEVLDHQGKKKIWKSNRPAKTRTCKLHPNRQFYVKWKSVLCKFC